MRGTSIRPYAMLCLLCLILYLPGLAAIPPLDRDEARFAQATRQMLETGDFVRIRDEARATGAWPPNTRGQFVKQENMLVVPASFSPLR